MDVKFINMEGGVFTLSSYGLEDSGLIEWCEQLCLPDKVLLDIGANNGAFTISLANKCKKVYAFESQQMAYYALCGGVALSNLENVVCLNYKLGETEQIDNIFNLEDPNIGLIIINAGSDLLSILRGGMETLKRNYPKILFKCDIFSINCIKFLSDIGYKSIKIDNCINTYLAERDFNPLHTEIPIIVICYNNWKYVLNTINQIRDINPIYYNNIQILNNCSTCKDTILFLQNVGCKVIHNEKNNGPWVSQCCNEHIYNQLPNKFILTDPDLEFNNLLPTNFIEILSTLSDKYNCGRIGLSLDISDFSDMYQLPYTSENKNIYEHEIHFWKTPIKDDEYELYYAAIDTTFCLINKNYQYSTPIRVAREFTAKHLPWYVDNKIYSIYENYLSSISTTEISTISKIIISYIENNYIKVNKNDEYFFILNDENDINLKFWKEIYTNWEVETFSQFDKLLSKDKIFIDIGGWIGTTCIYGSRKSKHVYTIEADTSAVKDMKKNIKNNNINNSNITVINKAMYNINNIDIIFGRNKFLNNSRLNDSTSQIYTSLSSESTESSDSYYSIKTISLQKMIEEYNIDISQISLIKVDIEGGEEFILDDLLKLNKEYNIPLYISFHYDWWENKDLYRFPLLINHVDKVINDPFISILF